MSFSYCLVISQTVSSAMETAVKASISTPVCALVFTVAVAETVVFVRDFYVYFHVCQRQGVAEWDEVAGFFRRQHACDFGGVEGVAFSDFTSLHIRAIVSGLSFIVPDAVASRNISAFPETSTIAKLCSLCSVVLFECVFLHFNVVWRYTT